MVMTMWARIQDGVVVETTDIDPEGRFHPELIWLQCPPDTLVGWVIVDDVYQPPAEEVEIILAGERAWRDFQLNATEWVVSRHRDEIDMQVATTLTAEQYAELLLYRQLLRDWPQADQFPLVSNRPAPPAWLAEDGTVVESTEPSESEAEPETTA